MAALWTCCKWLSVVIGYLVFVCCLRTFVLLNSLNASKEKYSSGIDDHIELNQKRWERFRTSLRIRTITHDLPNIERLLNYVIEAHPTIFKSDLVSYEIVNGYSLLVHVQGSDKELVPYLLAAHFDVVPVVESEWMVDPFNATEYDGKVYARGALDNKGNLMAHLAALEFLLDNGVVPKRSFYLAYGHDEEILGPDGAPEIAKTLVEKEVNKLHFVIDEGLAIFRDMIKGVKDIAMIGVTEKGNLILNLTVNILGGHSSMPPTETAVGVLAKAVHRLETNPIPGRIDELVSTVMVTLAPELGFPINVVATNQWLFGPLMWRLLARNKIAKGMVGSTTAISVFNGGEKYNVIPSYASAIVNQKIHPGDTVEQVLEYDRRIINDDRVKFSTVMLNPPHPISPFDRSSSLAYQVLTDTIEEVFENTLIGPGTLVANTDTRCYLKFSDNVYRFSPFIVTEKDIAGLHAKNEALSKMNFERAMNFFYRVMRNADRTALRDMAHGRTEL